MTRDYSHKDIVIVGAGSSGLALAEFLCRQGARVTLSDRRGSDMIDGLERLAEFDVTCDFGGHDAELFRRADLIVVSPGVPLSVAAIAGAREAGVKVLGEIEIAASAIDAPIVAVTGTNGKSTTTTLLGEIYDKCGGRTFVGGNLGTPMVTAAERDWDRVVVELSSFQLEAIETFRPRCALLLNISEDHLDRYPDMAAYTAAKRRVFENQTEEDVMVLNADDPQVQRLAEGAAARRVEFSLHRRLSEGMSRDGAEIVWRWRGAEERFAADELRVKGAHNLENVMAAMIPPLLDGCDSTRVWEAARAFRGLPHRMEMIRVLDGVTYCNDSKATNVGSVVKSLEGLDGPVTLIAGGKDKGGDYHPLAEQVRSKVDHLLLIGEAAPRLERALGHLADCRRFDTLEAAVRSARTLTPAGGMVLLSPGCSSFDMFASFEERGGAFARAVGKLEERSR